MALRSILVLAGQEDLLPKSLRYDRGEEEASTGAV